MGVIFALFVSYQIWSKYEASHSAGDSIAEGIALFVAFSAGWVFHEEPSAAGRSHGRHT